MSIVFERLPVIVRPGWDCITGNHCEHAGKPGLNHGIHGDEFLFGVRCELPDGRMAAITLEVFTSRYPATVEPWRKARAGEGYPDGASLALHLQLARDAPAPEYKGVVDDCEWLGSGRRCAADSSCSMASDLYRAFGVQSDAPSVDLTKQSEEFWRALELQLARWTEPAAEAK